MLTRRITTPSAIVSETGPIARNPNVWFDPPVPSTDWPPVATVYDPVSGATTTVVSPNVAGPAALALQRAHYALQDPVLHATIFDYYTGS